MNDYSTTSFEHKLGVMKKLIRGGNRMIEQIVIRVEETMDYEIQQFKQRLAEGM